MDSRGRPVVGAGIIAGPFDTLITAGALTNPMARTGNDGRFELRLDSDRIRSTPLAVLVAAEGKAAVRRDLTTLLSVGGDLELSPIQLADGAILCPSSTEHRGWRVHFELTRICRSPGEALAGALGALLIETARRRLEPELGRRAYHDRLLRHGPVAVPLVLRTEFGTDLWRQVAADLGI